LGGGLQSQYGPSGFFFFAPKAASNKLGSLWHKKERPPYQAARIVFAEEEGLTIVDPIGGGPAKPIRPFGLFLFCPKGCFKRAWQPLAQKRKAALSGGPYCLCGGGGIRTPGTSRYDGFQDRCNQPLCHSSVVVAGFSGRKDKWFFGKSKLVNCEQ
jgi:hypothetical protein